MSLLSAPREKSLHRRNATLLSRRRSAKIPLWMVLVVPFVLATVASVGLTAYLSFRNGQQAVKELAFRLMGNVGDRTQLYLQQVLETPHLINQMNEDVLQSGAISMLSSSDSTWIEDYFWRRIQRFPMVNSIAVGNQRGGVVEIRRTGTQQLSMFQTEQFASGAYSVAQLDSQGQALDPKISDPRYDARAQVWFQRAAETGRAGWSEVHQRDGRQPSLGMTASLPVFDRQGNLQAVLKTDLCLQQVNEFLQSLKPTPHGEILLVERSGLVLASSAQKFPFKFRRQKYERLSATRIDNDSISTAADGVMNQFNGFDQIHKPEQFTYTQSETRYFVHAAPFRDRYGLDWVIMVAVPESDFMQEIAANQRLTLWLSTGALVIAIALGLFTSALIAKPILRLSRASRDLALGKLEDEIDTNTPIAELEMLGRFFNDMTDHLQTSFDQVKVALQESEKKFTKVFRTSPDPIVISTLREGRCLEVNDSFLLWLKRSRAEVVGVSTLELGLWASAMERETFVRLLQSSGRISEKEFTLHRADNGFKTLLVTSELVELDGQTCILSVGKDITERKRLELALQKSEAKLKAVLTSAITAVAFFRLYPDDTIEYEFLSPSHEAIFGFAEAELRANTRLWGSRVHMDDRQQGFRLVPNGPAAPGSFVTEYRFCHKDGHWIWILDYITYRWNAEESCCLVTSVGIDISDRKQAEARLRQSETALREAQEIAHIGSWEYDAIANTTHWSEEMFRIHRFAPPYPPLTPTEAFETIHPDDRESYLALYRESVATGTSHKTDLRILCGDGSIRYVEVQGKPIFDDRGQLIRICGTALDITDRKQVEEALRQSEQRFRGAFDTAAVGICLCSVDGQFLQVNPAFCQMVGFTEAELQTMKFQDLTHADDLLADLVLYQRMLTGELPAYTLEKRYLHKSGRTVWVILSVSMVQDRQGTPLYIVGHVQNITIRKQAEKVLQQRPTCYLDILEDQTAMIALFLPSGVLTFVNEAFCTYFGLERQTAIGRQLGQLVFGEDQERLAKWIQSANQANPIVTMKIRVVVQGEVRWTQWTNRAIFDDNDQIIEYQAVGREIDNLRRVVAGLEVKENHTTPFPA